MSKHTAEDLKKKLIEKLNAQHVEVRDESDGCGGKFNCIIVSEKFENKTLIQKHRLVNSALADELKDIHAFSQKTYTPKQWEAEQNK